MSVDADIQREHAYQREHLEKTVSTLKKRLASDNQHHRDDNVRIMQVSWQLLHHRHRYVVASLTTSKHKTPPRKDFSFCRAQLEHDLAIESVCLSVRCCY